MALQQNLTLRKIKQLNFVNYLHIFAQCIMDIASISLSNLHNYIENSLQRGTHRQRMLVFRKWYSIGLGIGTSPASAVLIKSQTDSVYMETDAGLQAVEGLILSGG